MEKTLRRYTELPFVIDFLQTKELVLLSPSTWDDKNDSFFIEKYAEKKGVLSTSALCLTDCYETYHHWRIFSSGSSGVCIEFNKENFIKNTALVPDLRTEPVKYYSIKDLEGLYPEDNDLPFLKRYAFKDENEFRLFRESSKPNNDVFRFKMPVSAIQRIILSPWLPPAVSDHIKETLKSIPGCTSIPIYRSSLVENEQWKKIASDA